MVDGRVCEWWVCRRVCGYWLGKQWVMDGQVGGSVGVWVLAGKVLDYERAGGRVCGWWVVCGVSGAVTTVLCWDGMVGPDPC